MNRQPGKPMQARHPQIRSGLDKLEEGSDDSLPEREHFFLSAYEKAAGDAASIPWADMKPKNKLVEWLKDNPAGPSQTAIDIACGLGDNAEALSAAGYQTTAFDLSPEAINWASQRFPDSCVDYQVANLMELPEAWLGAFDVVHECYTIQSVPPELQDDFARAISGLVAPGGRLLVYARALRPGQIPQGPPWPLPQSLLDGFDKMGLESETRDPFDIVRPDRQIAHEFSVWRKAV